MTEGKMADLTALIERLEKADGPSRELDAAIAEAVGEAPGKDWTLITHSEGTFNIDAGRWIKGSLIRTPLNRTGSIDGAVAMARCVLPGVELEITTLYSVARVTLHHEIGPFYGSSETNSIPIAICMSVLRALSAQEGSK